MQLDKDTSYLIDCLGKSGFKAYAVGGCVRDLLMEKVPHDWDICTSAVPAQIKSVFSRFDCIETGIKHGTVTVIYNKHAYEITTMRTEGKYLNNRRPEAVSFVNDICKDLIRRDFTINAMAYNSTDGIIDPYDGQSDIINKIIRCVGNPDKRFYEDGLRIMRALRFSAVLDFDIEDKTAESIHKNKHLLANISRERIRDEFLKLLCGSRAADVIREYFDVITVFIPEFTAVKGFLQNTPHHQYDVMDHILKSVEYIESDPFYRCIMFFHDIGKPYCYKQDDNGIGHFKGHDVKSAEITVNVMQRLRFPVRFMNHAVKLIKIHDTRTQATAKAVRRLMSRIGYDDTMRLLKIQMADTLAQSMYQRDKKIERIESVRMLAQEIYEKNECFSLESLDINGNDLIQLGMKGKEVGNALSMLLNAVVDEDVLNEKRELIKYLSQKSV